MQSNYEVGYKKPPVSGRFQKGMKVNPAGRTKEHRVHFDPGVILQTIESETVLIRSNGKKKRMPKAEIDFRQLFGKAAKGDMEAAKRVLTMSKRYFAPDAEPENAPCPLLLTEPQFKKYYRDRARKKSVQLISRSAIFRKIAQEQVSIKIDGEMKKRSIFEAMLRQMSTMALNCDVTASNLLEVARKQFPGIGASTKQVVFLLSEVDARL
jgi:Family of unknown function (DUF5681)